MSSLVISWSITEASVSWLPILAQLPRDLQVVFLFLGVLALMQSESASIILDQYQNIESRGLVGALNIICLASHKMA